MGLFDKKFCDICGEKIGFLGNRKVEDGNICSKCAKKLSPFFTGRKKSTVDDIKRQLAYREENRQKLEAFHTTRSFGYRTKVYIDDNNRCFVVSKHNDFRAENADMIPFDLVTGANYSVEEHRSQLYHRDAQGRSVSYNPPRYEYSYEFTIRISVNSPYFDEIEFELTDNRPDSRYSDAYRRFEDEANQITGFFKNAAFAANAPQQGFVHTNPVQPPMQQGYGQPLQQGFQQGFLPAGLCTAADATGLSTGLCTAADAAGLSTGLCTAADATAHAARLSTGLYAAARAAGWLDVSELRQRQQRQILRQLRLSQALSFFSSYHISAKPIRSLRADRLLIVAPPEPRNALVALGQ